MAVGRQGIMITIWAWSSSQALAQKHRLSMESETLFRIALFVIMTLTMSVTAYYRWQAAASRERISHQEEGYLFAAVLRLAGLCLWVSTIAWLISPASVRWAALPLPDAIRWCGAVTGGLCSLLMFWTLSNLGRNLTDTVVTRAAATLVTRGPYRFVRHPFYVTAGLLMMSMTLLASNGLIGCCGLLVMLLLAFRTRKEEQVLIDRFGQAYRDYMSTTGRFIPRISH